MDAIVVSWRRHAPRMRACHITSQHHARPHRTTHSPGLLSLFGSSHFGSRAIVVICTQIASRRVRMRQSLGNATRLGLFPLGCFFWVVFFVGLFLLPGSFPPCRMRAVRLYFSYLAVCKRGLFSAFLPGCVFSSLCVLSSVLWGSSAPGLPPEPGVRVC